MDKKDKKDKIVKRIKRIKKFKRKKRQLPEPISQVFSMNEFPRKITV